MGDVTLGTASLADVEHGLAVLCDMIGGTDVAGGVRVIDALDRAALHPIERNAVSTAVLSRQCEFATGRALLRALLGADVPIPMAPDRRPVLPRGIRASLAHDDELAVAVMARSDRILAIGVDVEQEQTLALDVARAVSRSDERSIDPLLLFCAKESVYKAWSQQGGRFLDHADVRVTVDDRAFTAVVLDPGTVFTGAWTAAGGRIITVARLSAPAQAPLCG